MPRPDDGTPLPTVTIVMPVRNEQGYIEEAVRSVLAQDYPADLLEVIVADGASTDGTRSAVDAIAARDPRVQVVDNPEGIVPTGLNRAIERAGGSVIIRVDGHCDIDPDFVRASVQALAAHEQAWAVGGPIVHRGRGTFGRAAAYAMSSPVGVGGASHRFEDYEGFSDSVAFPAFRREVFDSIGLFDEALVRNQDDELNFRITQAGGKIWVSPTIRYRYYVREHPRQLFRQYYQYAFWRLPMLRKHRRPTTVRQLVPPLFYVAMGAGAVAGVVVRRPIVGLALPSLYAAALAAFGVRSLRDLDPATAARVPAAAGILHASYAAGWIAGIWSSAFRPHAWDHGGSTSVLSR